MSPSSNIIVLSSLFGILIISCILVASSSEAGATFVPEVFPSTGRHGGGGEHSAASSSTSSLLLETTNDFRNLVANSTLTLVALTSKDCGACQALWPMWTKVAENVTTAAAATSALSSKNSKTTTTATHHSSSSSSSPSALRFIWVECSSSKAANDFCRARHLFPKVSSYPYVTAFVNGTGMRLTADGGVGGDDGLRPRVDPQTGKAKVPSSSHKKRTGAAGEEGTEGQEDQDDDDDDDGSSRHHPWTTERLFDRVATLADAVTVLASSTAVQSSDKQKEDEDSFTTSLLEQRSDHPIVSVVGYIPRHATDLIARSSSGSGRPSFVDGKQCSRFPPGQAEYNNNSWHAFHHAAAFMRVSDSDQHNFFRATSELDLVKMMTFTKSPDPLSVDEAKFPEEDEEEEQEAEAEGEEFSSAAAGVAGRDRGGGGGGRGGESKTATTTSKNTKPQTPIVITDSDQANGVVASFVGEHTSALIHRSASGDFSFSNSVDVCHFTSRPVIGFFTCAGFASSTTTTTTSTKQKSIDNNNNNNNASSSLARRSCSHYTVRWHWMPSTTRQMLALLASVGRPTVSLVTDSSGDDERLYPGNIINSREPLSTAMQRPYAFETDEHHGQRAHVGHHPLQPLGAASRDQHHRHDHDHLLFQQGDDDGRGDEDVRQQRHRLMTNLQSTLQQEQEEEDDQAGALHSLVENNNNNQQHQRQHQHQHHAPPIFAVFVETQSCKGRPDAFWDALRGLELLSPDYRNTTFVVFDSLRHSEYYLRAGLTRPVVDKLRLGMVMLDHGRKFSVLDAMAKQAAVAAAAGNNNRRVVELVELATGVKGSLKDVKFSFDVDIARAFLRQFWSGHLRPFGRVKKIAGGDAAAGCSMRLGTARKVLDFFGAPHKKKNQQQQSDETHRHDQPLQQNQMTESKKGEGKKPKNSTPAGNVSATASDDDDGKTRTSETTPSESAKGNETSSGSHNNEPAEKIVDNVAKKVDPEEDEQQKQQPANNHDNNSGRSIRILLVESPIKDVSKLAASALVSLLQRQQKKKQRHYCQQQPDTQQPDDEGSDKMNKRKNANATTTKRLRTLFLELALFGVVNGDGRGALALEHLWPRRHSSVLPFLICVDTFDRRHEIVRQHQHQHLLLDHHVDSSHRDNHQHRFHASAPSFVEFDLERTREFTQTAKTAEERADLLVTWFLDLPCARQVHLKNDLAGESLL